MNRKHTMVSIVALLSLLGLSPNGDKGQNLSAELSRLARLGITHRYLNDSTIEMRDTIMGWSQVKTLREPDEAAIRTWASTRGIPVIDIDPD